jgi:hypothetical protein
MTVLTDIWNYIGSHGWTVLLIYVIYNAFVGSLKAPTATSSQAYISFFAIANALAVNFGRMFPKVESSPNFQPAVNLQQRIAGQQETAVKVPPEVEDKPKP